MEDLATVIVRSSPSSKCVIESALARHDARMISRPTMVSTDVIESQVCRLLSTADGSATTVSHVPFHRSTTPAHKLDALTPQSV
jgi:hypothetical protein